MRDLVLPLQAGAILQTDAARRFADRASVVVALLLVFAFAAYGVLRPAWNWDKIAYVAAALETRYSDPADLHRETWAIIKAGASEAQLEHLRDANPYNRANYDSPEALHSQLVMFRVKPAYVAGIRAMEPVFGVSGAAVAMSVLPALFVGAFAVFWLWRAGAAQSALLVVPALVMGDYFHMTVNVVPDMAHAALALPALLLLWANRNWWAAAFLVAAVAVRPDSVILTFAILLAALAFRLDWKPWLVALFGGLVVAKWIAAAGDHPGWWPHFVFSTVELQPFMAEFEPDFAFATMLKGYVRGISVSFQHSEWPWLLMMLTAGRLALLARGVIGSVRTEAIFLACFLGIGGKFLSFPLPDDRFYFIFIAGMAISLAVIARPVILPLASRFRSAA